MTNVRTFVRLIAKYTGRLSEADLEHYELFFTNRTALSPDLSARIEKEYASFITKQSPELAKSIAKEIKRTPKHPESFPEIHVEPVYLCNLSVSTGAGTQFIGEPSKQQEEWIEYANKEKRVLAAAPDIYQYLKTLYAMSNSKDFNKIKEANKRISELRGSAVLTSTRLFYKLNALDAQLVHYYGSMFHKPVEHSVRVPPFNKRFTEKNMEREGVSVESLLKEDVFYENGVQRIACPKEITVKLLGALFNTNEDSKEILKILDFFSLRISYPDYKFVIRTPGLKQRKQFPVSSVSFSNGQLWLDESYSDSCKPFGVARTDIAFFLREDFSPILELNVAGRYHKQGTNEIITITKRAFNEYHIQSEQWLGTGKLQGNVFRTNGISHKQKFNIRHVLKISKDTMKMEGPWVRTEYPDDNLENAINSRGHDVWIRESNEN